MITNLHENAPFNIKKDVFIDTGSLHEYTEYPKRESHKGSAKIVHKNYSVEIEQNSII